MAPRKGRKPKVAPRAGRRAALRQQGEHLLYKVVELSTVDEGALEHALNHWTRQGWSLDGIQFAMRESSKRPSMAFLFFTTDAPAQSPQEAPAEQGPAGGASAAWERLARLAGDDDEEPGR